MLCFSVSKNADTRRRIKITSGKKGFTLIETILAIAMLTILVVIVYQGFLSTIQFSANTAKYEQSANNADSQVELALSNAGSTIPTPVAGIFLKSTSLYVYSKVLPVAVFDAVPTTVQNYGIADYKESTSLPASNRHAFTYAARVCPVDGAQLAWYKDAGGNFKLFCPVENADKSY